MAQNGSPRKDWSSDQVVAAVRQKGLSMQELSESFGLSKGALTRALHSSSYPAHEELIAQFLDLQPDQIWPERWAKRRARAELKAQAKQKVRDIKSKQAA
ncbi:helix-turn-helix domain-containing protein [Aeromonas rivuli]|uniref:helix-turn-helix domain-containing protein n=1 Tax=Aeromonas rivuli TaxID=648794 RepID=UPI0005A6BA53|nr:helix-turn-helix domain-containing protein [Aeromonas rivuli]